MAPTTRTKGLTDEKEFKDVFSGTTKIQEEHASVRVAAGVSAMLIGGVWVLKLFRDVSLGAKLQC